MRKILFYAMMIIVGISSPILTFAANTTFDIIPQAGKDKTELWKDVECVAGKWEWPECQKWTVRDRINNKAEVYDGTKNPNGKPDIGACFATGIFSWNCALDWIVYAIQFLSQLGILVWAWMIIYAWYKYATAVFTGKSPSMSMVKDAIIGVLIIVFAYAIIKLLTAMFL